MIKDNLKFYKFFARILLPAIASLCFVWSQIWPLTDAEEVVGTLVLVILLLNIVLSIFQTKYNKEVMRGGVLSIIQTDEGDTFCLELGDDPEVLKTMKEVQFDIRKV